MALKSFAGDYVVTRRKRRIVANRWKGQDVLADFMRGVSNVLSARGSVQ
jgi:hypothetical protein